MQEEERKKDSAINKTHRSGREVERSSGALVKIIYERLSSEYY